jgi:hypothetical protein
MQAHIATYNLQVSLERLCEQYWFSGTLVTC